MAGPDFVRTNFLTFLPEPKKASPHRCGPQWATKCGFGQQRFFTRPSHPVHQMERGDFRGAIGNRQTVTDANANDTFYTYDLFDCLHTVTRPGSRG
jgi:YD repeat-containing protein